MNEDSRLNFNEPDRHSSYLLRYLVGSMVVISAGLGKHGGITHHRRRSETDRRQVSRGIECELNVKQYLPCSLTRK